MHLEYKPRDMIMVDFTGKTRHYIDTYNGEQIKLLGLCIYPAF